MAPNLRTSVLTPPQDAHSSQCQISGCTCYKPISTLIRPIRFSKGTKYNDSLSPVSQDEAESEDCSRTQTKQAWTSTKLSTPNYEPVTPTRCGIPSNPLLLPVPTADNCSIRNHRRLAETITRSFSRNRRHILKSFIHSTLTNRSLTPILIKSEEPAETIPNKLYFKITCKTPQFDLGNELSNSASSVDLIGDASVDVLYDHDKLVHELSERDIWTITKALRKEKGNVRVEMQDLIYNGLRTKVLSRADIQYWVELNDACNGTGGLGYREVANMFLIWVVCCKRLWAFGGADGKSIMFFV